MRRLCVSLLVVALAGCGSTGNGGKLLAAGPHALDQLRRQANHVVSGSPGSFQRQLKALHGHPVVVNQWASWCGPCRFEFPFFQKLARRYAGRVAFLGVNSNDNAGDARKFLKQFPVPYPSCEDGDSSIARAFGGGRAWPTTAFYDATGKQTDVHPGGYASQSKLDADIRRYALHG